MQYWILTAVFIALLAIIAGKNISSLHKRRVFHNRKITLLDEIWANNFSTIDETEFNIVWEEVSTLLNVDKNRLSPDDKLKEIAKLYPFPENLCDDLEEYLSRMGIHHDTSKKGIAERTVGDLVSNILQKKKRLKVAELFSPSMII